MGLHWIGYDTRIVGKNTFIVTEQVNYLAHVEANTPKYNFLCPHKENLFYINNHHFNYHFLYKNTNAKRLLSCRFHYKNAVLRIGAQYKSTLFGIQVMTKEFKKV
jgi:hypothetical protein